MMQSHDTGLDIWIKAERAKQKIKGKKMECLSCQHSKADDTCSEFQAICSKHADMLVSVLTYSCEDYQPPVRRENDAHRIFSEETTGDCFDCGKPFDHCDCEQDVHQESEKK